MRRTAKILLLSSVAAFATTEAAHAADQERDGTYNLGQLVTISALIEEVPIGGVVIGSEDLWRFEKPNLEQAVSLAPGVNATFDSNGRRNESDIFVRGFGRWQVPLMIDGVRVYLPADNRLDFSRFVTSDIGEIEIQKGYASVLDGPGAMGGAINLVSRKPVEPLEAEFQIGSMIGRLGDFEGWQAYGRVGGRQEKFYLQASGSYFKRDFWTMSADYNAVPGSLEDGDRRFNSDSIDWRMNLKAGLTPNRTDEYSINFIHQEGAKSGLLNVYNNPPVPGNAYWDWPWWNVESLAFLSHTQIGSSAYLETKFYYNTFDNALFAYDNISYTSQANPGRFRSYYEDDAYGASLEAGMDIGPSNSVKAAFHYRSDTHTEFSHNRPDNPNPALNTIEPEQEQSQTTWSVALEDRFRASEDFEIVAGASYDKFDIDQAEEFDGTSLFEYPKGGAEAFNWQAAAIWSYSDIGQIHASVSSRTRFAGIWELYSTRFGTAVPNPNLGAERSTNVELGWQGLLFGNTEASAAIFYSEVSDLIQTVQVSAGPPPMTQTQNVGNGEFYGFEASFDTEVTPEISFGGNYTYIERDIEDALQPDLRVTGVPRHKAFLYATWRPIPAFSLTPNIEIASSRWSDVSTSPAQAFPYIRTGSYTLVNLQAEYAITENLEFAVGAKNIFDDNYELSWGFPQAGRNYYLKLRAVY